VSARSTFVISSCAIDSVWPVLPLDRDSAPHNFDNGTAIGYFLVPAHTVTDFELSGLFADHIKSSPSPSARHHHGNIPRCENSQGPEKTDGNSQEQAAVWHLASF
jgi:hypothetical protein